MPADARMRLLRDPWFIVGILLLTPLAASAGLGPFLVAHDPSDMSFVPLSPPSAEHWLGVNDGGMDILSELVFGLKNTMLFGLAAGTAGLFLGAFIGLAAAWFGGWTDRILMRMADVILAIPAVMVLILLAAFFRPSPLVLALTLAALAWPTTAKSIRAQALPLKTSLHIQAARRMGASGFYIIRRHLTPELFPLYLTGFAAKTRMAMFMEASLSFLGLFDPSRKSLGGMISYALKFYYLDIHLHWLTPPVLCLTLLIMSSTFLAIGLEKVLDPRLREQS
ncbi:MAG: ABC transporter permease [Pseudomonadota bacterium]